MDAHTSEFASSSGAWSLLSAGPTLSAPHPEDPLLPLELPRRLGEGVSLCSLDGGGRHAKQDLPLRISWAARSVGWMLFTKMVMRSDLGFPQIPEP